MDSKTAVFGGGCFWCTEAIFRQLRGVKDVEPGYAGGKVKNPTYEQVSSGKTGHAEVIRVTYDPKEISYDDLLTVYFASHDPTTPGRQGPDIGEQYRSIILYETEEEKKIAIRRIDELQKELKDGTRPVREKPRRSVGAEAAPLGGAFSNGASIVTEVKQLEQFYEAEDYHKKYFENNKSAPYCQIVIEPKIEKIRVRFEKLLKDKSK